MARNFKDIYFQAKQFRNERLELSEIQNPSKMSVMDAITWVTSACIWSFENLLDVFKVDLAQDLNNRINGTPAYFSNALLKYQAGDDLLVSEDGSSFYYANVDENKRIISKAAYTEATEEGFHDKLMIFKIASGEPGNYHQIDEKDLIDIRKYLSQILFAGQHSLVVSRKGDILIPRLTVYYDGLVASAEVYKNIKDKLNEFIKRVGFDSVIYVQKIIDCIQKAEHVVDVHCTGEGEGIFVVQYDDDNHVAGGSPVKVDRFFIPNSGYVRESSGQGDESSFQTWDKSITLRIEKR